MILAVVNSQFCSSLIIRDIQQNVQQSCNHSNCITIAITGLFGLSGNRVVICYTAVDRFANALTVSILSVNGVACWKTVWGSGV